MGQNTNQLPPAVILFIISVLVFLLFGCGTDTRTRSALVFSKTEGFRHASIGAGKQAFLDLGEKHGFRVDTTEDASLFTQENLQQYNLVIFLSTTGDVLNAEQQTELERFMKAGGSWMGVHAAADTEYNWPWYNELCGAYFLSHPEHQEATVNVLEPGHKSVAHLQDDTWKRFDEWYNYKNIKEGITPILSVDESTYEGGENGDFHPIAWYRDFENGRSFYTGLGHTEDSYTDPVFVQHLLGGMEYAWGEGQPVNYDGVKRTPEENRFQVEALVTGMTEPMELELLPDGRPIWIERKGRVMLYDHDFEMALEVARFDVWSEHEDGLLGIALDPDFATNNWAYFYYSPPGEASVNRLSRFKLDGDSISFGSEQVILDVPVERNECCHSGGSIEFGGTGLLHLSIGDNTNPFKSDGYSPLDDSRGEVPNFDARRSAANTKDLRGGIIRIKVEEDGSYSIPEGNLFTDPDIGRPEIYAMGMRNPFRISVDQRNGNIYWGDIGPDAHKDSTGLGPRGHDEVNVATEAGFFGWPLFIGDNQAYHERDFAEGRLGLAYTAAKPINDSKFNTGNAILPPAQPAMLYYPYAQSEVFPELGSGGRNAMAGPVFYHEDYNDSEHRFPAYYDGKFFFYDWMRDYIMAADLDEEGRVTEFERFLPSAQLLHPMDMLFSPDGELYVIEYGTKWFARNGDARLLRIRYNAGNRAPAPAFELAEHIGKAPFTIKADAGNTVDYDGDELALTWLLDGKEIGTGSQLSYVVKTNGLRKLTLSVDDGQGNVTELERELLVGNSIPHVNLRVDGNSSFFYEGDRINYLVSATDEEDGEIDPTNITVTFDYLEGEDLVQIEAGHQVAGQNTAYTAGKNLMEASDCAGCHLLNEDSSGPALVKVAERYRPDVDAADYLAGKIIQGGGGVWGERQMAAHPDIPKEDAVAMADYILSLAGPPPSQTSLPPRGTLVLNKHRPGIPGRYILQASYTDKGGDGLPKLTTKEVITLRNPTVRADLYTSGKKVLAYLLKAEDNPVSDEDTNVLVATAGGWSSYGGFDLNGVEYIKATVGLSPGVTTGGTITVLAGDPYSGEVVGEVTVEQGISTYGMNQLTIPVKTPAKEGKQELFFRYRADSDNPEAVMAAVASYEFVRKSR